MHSASVSKYIVALEVSLWSRRDEASKWSSLVWLSALYYLQSFDTGGWQLVKNMRLTLDTKLRVYQTLVLSVLLYAADTWILLSADVRTLDAFHQKCLRQLLGIRWYNRVQNAEVLQWTGLTSLSHLLSHRRISVFGHVAWLDDDTPANVALQLHINVSLNRPPDRTWRHPPGRPRNKWLDRLRNDSTCPIETSGDMLWCMVVQRRVGPRWLDDNDEEMPPLAGVQALHNTWFLGPTFVITPNCTSISLVIFRWLIVVFNIHTDHVTSVTIGHIYAFHRCSLVAVYTVAGTTDVPDCIMYGVFVHWMYYFVLFLYISF